jgi:hypothetical protein
MNCEKEDVSVPEKNEQIEILGEGEITVPVSSVKRYVIGEKPIRRRYRRLKNYPVPNIQMKKGQKIFENQDEFGDRISKRFEDKSIIMVLAIAPTQSGKTGSMIASAMKMCESSYIQQDMKNVYVITGFSSRDWVNQTKNRFPHGLDENVYHRNTLDKFVDEVKDKRDLFIMIDEVQYACMPNQSLYKTFEKCGWISIKNMEEKNIKILVVSATPDGIRSDLGSWSKGVVTEFMTPIDTYVSIEKLYREGRVKPYKDLYDENEDYAKENINELLIEISKIEDPKYHILRTKNSKAHEYIMNKIKIQNTHEKFVPGLEIKSEMNVNMDKLFDSKPTNHTIVCIKEKLRCAKTLPKDHLGIVYERHTNTVNDSAIIQGLAGRMTGYHNNKDSVIFTNTATIEKYVCMSRAWMRGETDEDEEEDRLPWMSNSTKKSGSKKTFLYVDMTDEKTPSQ